MIVFVHIPNFYAAVEQAALHRTGEPLIVGGDPDKGACVLSASPEAQALGIVEGMSVEEALRRSPEVVLRPTRMRAYREAMGSVRALLHEKVERLEVSQNQKEGVYLECAAQLDPVSLAADACVRLKSELGLGATAGIGPTRFVAFLAARHAGDSGLRHVPASEALCFLARFPVSELWGLGPQTAAKLARAGIERIVDLQRREPSELAAIVGRRGAVEFLKLATARDEARLRPAPRAKSLSRERTLGEPSADRRVLATEILDLASALEALLERERQGARTVSLRVTYAEGDATSRSHTGDRVLTRQQEIAEAGVELLARTEAGLRPVRKLSLKVSNLSRRDAAPDPRQLRLFA